MKKLTIGISHRDRWEPGSDISDLFEKSLENQTCKDFEVLITDGGSRNFNELEKYCRNRQGDIKFRMFSFPIGHKFERARLNNVAIRNATTPYILTTDIDMFFADNFVETILANCRENVFLEARTLYWKSQLTNLIYDGELDPFNDLDSVRIGRIKRRTSAGGCQCAHIDTWTKVRGFDERMVGWGSEDYDLLLRMQRAGVEVKWLCENREEIMVFHQHHAKENVQFDLECQEENKKILNDTRKERRVNPDGWGGKKS